MREIEWDPCLLERRRDPEYEKRYRRETGRPDRTALYFLGNPWVEETLISFGVELETRIAIDGDLADLVGMVVSQDNSCRYCFAAMRAELAAYNRELANDGLPLLSIGVGLHRGTGVAGLVGSKDLKEFAFVGRTVNVAARVQGLTRQYSTDIILTEDLRKTLDPRFRLRALPPTPVKGVAGPLSIYAVQGFDNAEQVKGQTTA